METAIYFATTLGLGTLAATVVIAIGSRILSKLDSLTDKVHELVTKDSCAAHRSAMARMFNNHFHNGRDALIIRRVAVDEDEAAVVKEVEG